MGSLRGLWVGGVMVLRDGKISLFWPLTFPVVRRTGGFDFGYLSCEIEHYTRYPHPFKNMHASAIDSGKWGYYTILLSEHTTKKPCYTSLKTF